MGFKYLHEFGEPSRVQPITGSERENHLSKITQIGSQDFTSICLTPNPCSLHKVYYALGAWVVLLQSWHPRNHACPCLDFCDVPFISYIDSGFGHMNCFGQWMLTNGVQAEGWKKHHSVELALSSCCFWKPPVQKGLKWVCWRHKPSRHLALSARCVCEAIETTWSGPIAWWQQLPEWLLVRLA